MTQKYIGLKEKKQSSFIREFVAGEKIFGRQDNIRCNQSVCELR